MPDPREPTNYMIDIEKLFNAVDTRRRQSKLSWARLAARLGTSPSTLSGMTRVQSKSKTIRHTMDGTILVKCLMYLNKPHTDFIKIIPWEVHDDANS